MDPRRAQNKSTVHTLQSVAQRILHIMKNDASIQMIQSGGTLSGDLLVPPAPPLTQPWTRGLPGRWPEGVVLKGRSLHGSRSDIWINPPASWSADRAVLRRRNRNVKHSDTMRLAFHWRHVAHGVGRDGW